MREPILCFSHLRWNFVFQRPQHLLSRLARRRDVYFIEEAQFRHGITPHYIEEFPVSGVTVIRPQLPHMDCAAAEMLQEKMLGEYVSAKGIAAPVLWYYTPMALGYTARLDRSLSVFDCMDELSMFAHAPSQLVAREADLLSQADVVFTGGRSLYYSKRRRHGNVHCLPSGVDANHFAASAVQEPEELLGSPHPRFGFYGVIDERFDIDYLDGIAELRPNWHFVIVGPVVKIDEARLPVRANIQYIGQRSYDELPAYLNHWDVAMLPFALNDATRFISPTKTLEYLAAGKPTISTPIADVIDPYGQLGIVTIAPTPGDFVRAGERFLHEGLRHGWHEDAQRMVRVLSWDSTVERIEWEIRKAAEFKAVARA